MEINRQELEQRLLKQARADLGGVEKTRNQARWIEKYWPRTSYPEGYRNREPYCAAACVYWLWAFLLDLANDGLLQKVFGAADVVARMERWRCKSARAFDWREWGKKAKGVQVLDETQSARPGDFVVFDFSHIGMVVEDRGATLLTIEANTNSAGSREGDGCWQKTRPRSLVQCFVRVIPNNLPAIQ